MKLKLNTLKDPKALQPAEFGQYKADLVSVDLWLNPQKEDYSIRLSWEFQDGKYKKKALQWLGMGESAEGITLPALEILNDGNEFADLDVNENAYKAHQKKLEKNPMAIGAIPIDGFKHWMDNQYLLTIGPGEYNGRAQNNIISIDEKVTTKARKKL